MHPSLEREIREILIAANSGEATEVQFARLDELIRSDVEHAAYCARMVEQQAALAWQGVRRDPADAAPPAPRFEAIPIARHRPAESQAFKKPRDGMRGWIWPAIAAGVAFVAGVGMTTFAWKSWNAPGGSTSVPLAAIATDEANTPGGYEAQLVRSTACLWDPSSHGSRAIGSLLTSGESLDLLEGLAGINLSWSMGGTAVVSLEGPAAMMLTREGMPTLRFGKLTATISTDRRPFILETPVGRLQVSEYGSIGVSAFGNDAEIHVFDGAASLESAWIGSADRDGAPLRIEAGEAVRIQAGANGELVVERRTAEQAYFVAQVSMTSDALVVPEEYASAVKALNPVGYWRLERDAWPLIPNEVGPRFECHVNGSLGRTDQLGNQSLEFGVTDQGGDVLCNEVLDDVIGDSYSLEAWIKPSHYHVGAVVSLVGDRDPSTGVIPHGMLLEMGGSGLIPTAVHHPGRIRFLHRSPASDDRELGTSCYSESPYTLRKWQHVVAVKDGSAMRLYVNGELVGEGQDTNTLPSGLRLLVGRLYPSRGVRPFIGQLDELALYDRALSPEEIFKHYRIIRPKTAPKTSI